MGTLGIEPAMRDALSTRPEAVALACLDTASGLLLGLQVRRDAPREDLQIATCAAGQLCAAPRADGSSDDLELAEESFVVSSEWLHVFARVPSRRDLVVVGLAPGDSNVALFRAWIRQVAELVGLHA